jgi:N-acetylmuramoyl-L-alanine amidase
MCACPKLPLAALGTVLVYPLIAICDPPSTKAVTAVRFWSFADTTRVVIETTGEFEFRSDRAPNPDRLFFDILGARTRLAKRGQNTFPVGDKLVKQIRVAETLPGVTRIVFDLESSADFTASQLTNPDRLIVELRPTRPELPSPPPLKQTADMELERQTAVVVNAGATEKPLAAPRESLGLPRQTPPPALPKPPVNARAASDATRGSERASAPLTAPRPAKLRSAGEQLTRVLGLKINRIVLDPGHGGHDTGTYGPGGLLEKDLVLDVCKRLGALIQSRLGSEVVYTRTDDTFVPLEMRTQVANEHRADLFLSIHANSSPATNSSGVETYYLNFTNSRTALEVATRENASSQKSVYELKDLLQRIAVQEKMDESRDFAAKIQTALYSASAKANTRTRDRGVKKAPFVVLIGASMPSVLAEIGFVSNPRDEVLLKRPEVRQKIAEGLYKGVSQYASTLSHFQVAKSKED